MNLRCLSVVLAFALATVAAQEQPHIDLSFFVGDENRSIQLRCGIDSTATDGLDLQLGEYPIPGHPPDGFHAAFEITTDNITDLSYTDVRPYPGSPTEQFVVEYSLNVTPKFYGRGDLLIFSWEYPLPRGIDSVVVTDRLGGVLARVVFGWQRADTLRGTTAELERFLVRVYYTPSRASFVDGSSAHPALQIIGGELLVPLPTSPAAVVLTSLTGKQRTPGYSYDGRYLHCPLTSLEQGLHLLTVVLLNGECIFFPILSCDHSTFVFNSR